MIWDCFVRIYDLLYNDESFADSNLQDLRESSL